MVDLSDTGTEPLGTEPSLETHPWVARRWRWFVPLTWPGVRPIYWVSQDGVILWVSTGRRTPARKRFGVKTDRPDAKPGRGMHRRVNLATETMHQPPTAKRARQKLLTVRVHQIVASAWHGAAKGELIRHLDGDGEHNDVENLRPGTEGENLADQYRHGTRTSRTAAAAARIRWSAQATPEDGALTFDFSREAGEEPAGDEIVYVPDAELGF